jgi:hypothetical protein
LKFYLRVAETEREDDGIKPTTLVSEDNDGSRLSHKDEDVAGSRHGTFQRFSQASSHE